MMGSHAGKAEAYADAIHRELHRLAFVRSLPDGFHVILPCDTCGNVDAFLMRSKIPPDQIANHLRRKGWTIDVNRRALCPDHQPERKERPLPTTDEVAITAAVEDASVRASEAAKAAKRNTISLLEDVFDVKNGCYRGKENDETVGKTVGLAAPQVKLIREEFFGVIKRPPELNEIFEALDILQTQLNEGRANTLGEMQGYDAAIANLRGRVEAIARKYA